MADELQVERDRLMAQSTQINKRIAELDAQLSGQNKLNDLMGLAKANVGLMQQMVQAATMLKQRIDDLDDKRVTFESILGQLRSFLIDNVAKRISRLEEQAGIEDDLGCDGKTGQEWIALILAFDLPGNGLQRKKRTTKKTTARGKIDA